MKDVTALLVHYSDPAALHQALKSLKRIDSKLQSVIVLHERKMPINMKSSKIEYVSTGSDDHGQSLNEIIDTVNTPYVLFLYGTDVLSPAIPSKSLKLPGSKTVLGTRYYNRDTVIHRPVLVRTSRLKKEKFLFRGQLPFKEALFPAWLANVERSELVIKEDLVRQSKINRSVNTNQKGKMIQKYYLEKTNLELPSLSVIISAYNMETYVETAVASCILQNEAFEQVLIMDDGSTDNSHQRLKRWNDNTQVKLFRKDNEGKARALNELLPYVTSDFILELDADDWLDPDACFVIKKHLSNLSEEVCVLYGNLRRWKQLADDILFKAIAKGNAVGGTTDLLSYRFPLGPRVYRTSILKKEGGFPVISFEDGRFYEDVSVLYRLLKKYPFRYRDFTVYNVRKHDSSITKRASAKWSDFLKILKEQL